MCSPFVEVRFLTGLCLLCALFTVAELRNLRRKSSLRLVTSKHLHHRVINDSQVEYSANVREIPNLCPVSLDGWSSDFASISRF